MKLAVRTFVFAVMPAFFHTALRANEPTAQYAEVPVGYLAPQSVRAVLKKTLSAKGRYLLLPNVSTVRVYDDGEHALAARLALDELQHTPANVPFEIRVAAGMRRITRQIAPREPAVDYEIPFPRNYDPPRISTSYSGGPIIVVPAQPRNFATRRLGAGETASLSPTGYTTLDAQAKVSETVLEGGVARVLTGSAALGKPSVLSVSQRVADVAGLQAWARKKNAIPAAEPAWTAAATELVVTPEISNSILSLNLTPQIVVSTGYPSQRQTPRRIALRSCFTSVPIERGAATTLESFPGTDAEFYKVFFGAKESAEGTVNSISVRAAVHYLGQ